MIDLKKTDKENIWHPFTPLLGVDDPIVIQSGEGIYLNSIDGRKIIDAVSSWWVNLHGHSNKEIADAIAAQAVKLEHVIFAGFTHEPAITLSKNLLSILPDNQVKIFFSDDGSTAVEVGIKMALQYWVNKGVAKKKIVALEGAYHGDTFGAMSVGARGLFTNAFSDKLFDVEFIPFPGPGNENASTESFKKLAANGNIAAIIYEPLVQGAAGMRMYSPEVLQKLLDIASANNIVTIADEVFTGFGRTGKYFASEYADTPPDIMAVSKGITGGTLPLGVTTCSEKIVNAFLTEDFSKTFFHGHSYTANPLACAAANASFKILTQPSTQNQIRSIAESHKSFADSLSKDTRIENIRCRGTIIAIELKSTSATTYENHDRKRIYKYFLERNILLRPLGNIIYILPPYVITRDELNLVYQAIRNFIDEIS